MNRTWYSDEMREYVQTAPPHLFTPHDREKYALWREIVAAHDEIERLKTMIETTGMKSLLDDFEASAFVMSQTKPESWRVLRRACVGCSLDLAVALAVTANAGPTMCELAGAMEISNQKGE